jgi:hypothetical protein
VHFDKRPLKEVESGFTLGLIDRKTSEAVNLPRAMNE